MTLGSVLAKLSQNKEQIMAIIISAEDNCCFTGSEFQIRIWRLDTGNCVKTFDVIGGNKNYSNLYKFRFNLFVGVLEKTGDSCKWLV